MDRGYEISETIETWHVRVSCTPEEAPHVAAAVPKMLAGLTRCYQPDVVHVHQALQAAAAAPALPRSTRPALDFARN